MIAPVSLSECKPLDLNFTFHTVDGSLRSLNICLSSRDSSALITIVHTHEHLPSVYWLIILYQHLDSRAREIRVIIGANVSFLEEFEEDMKSETALRMTLKIGPATIGATPWIAMPIVLPSTD
jgi:hypothetical protein